MEHIYVAIDLKSFYASVECVERGLDPLTANLVVADPERTEKTICLAVSPSLKKYGIPGRARLFEVVQKVNELNKGRQEPIEFITAKPRMALYMEYSARIYQIYLKYIAPEDIHVYSVDEVFMDVGAYLNTYQMTARELVTLMIHDVLSETGITATCGIAPNMYLCKVAMDIVAKHMPADEDGVRIAEIDEMSYRKLLWNHRPLTDFWRVGRGYARKLEQNGLYTMGDIARCSLGSDKDYYNESLLYRLFGVNAELLIDHAWGVEPCTIADIKAYVPENNSLSQGQVLQSPYTAEKARIIVREMTEWLTLEMVEKGLVCDQLVLTVGYDIECISNKEISSKYEGEVTADWYGRLVPKHAHGSTNLGFYTSSGSVIMDAMLKLYDSIVNKDLLVRRMYVVANHVLPEGKAQEASLGQAKFEQLDLFTDYEKKEEEETRQREQFEKERSLQKAMISLKKRYGKNAVLKGTDLEEGATTIERNSQIGGHKA